MKLRVNSLTGVVTLGPNVVEVVPSPPSAGYVEASYSGDMVDHVSGSSSGEVFLEIIDPMKIPWYLSLGRGQRSSLELVLDESRCSADYILCTTTI